MQLAVAMTDGEHGEPDVLDQFPQPAGIDGVGRHDVAFRLESALPTIGRGVSSDPPAVRDYVTAGWGERLATRLARRRISAVVRPDPSGRQPGGPKVYIHASRSDRAERRSLKRPIQGEKFTTNG